MIMHTPTKAVNGPKNKKRRSICILVSIFAPLLMAPNEYKQAENAPSAIESSLLGNAFKSVIVEAFNGRLDTENPNKIHMNFTGRSFSMDFWEKNSRIILSIGTRTSKCFNLIIDTDSYEGDLNELYPAENCDDLPRKNLGSFLLKITDHIAESLALHEVSLVDASHISCNNKEDQMASLTFLRAIQKGKGWYEANGYLPAKNDYAIYKSQLIKIHLETINHFIKIINQLKDNPMGPMQNDHRLTEKINLLSDKLQKFSTLMKPQNTNEFVKWLWESDCKSYIIIIDKLLLLKSFNVLFPDNRLAIPQWRKPDLLYKKF